MHTIDLRNSGGNLVILGGAIALPTADFSVVSPEQGSIRWNNITQGVEYYASGTWTALNYGGVNFVGLWNASTNNPTLVSGTGNKGNYYKVSVAGNTLLDGISNWFVGDSVVFDGTAWDKLAGTDFPTIALTGDATGSGTTSIAVTLASIVTAGTYTKVTVDTKGRVTLGASANLDDLGDVEITTPGDNNVITYDAGSSKWVNIPPPYDIYGSFLGSPGDSQTLWRIVIARAITFPQDLVGSVAICLGAPLVDVSMPILKNGVQIGSIDFLSSTTQANFVFETLTVFNNGDVLEIDGPSPVDADFFSPSWAFVCFR
jgi:hypothetical protein